MTAHHDRVRAVLLVHGLKAAGGSDEDGGVGDLAARVIRIQARLDEIRPRAVSGRIGDRPGDVDTGAGAEEWMLAAYDAALIELCAALGVTHSLVDERISPERERHRVEYELRSSVPPLP